MPRNMYFALVLLLFTLCTEAQRSSDPKELFTLQNEGFNITKGIIREQEARGVNGTCEFQKEVFGDEKGRGLVFTSRKSKGKPGAYGGANIVRKPRPSNSTPSLLGWGCPVLYVSFALILLSLLGF